MVQARDHYPRDILRQIDTANTSEDTTIDDEHTNLT